MNNHEGEGAVEVSVQERVQERFDRLNENISHTQKIIEAIDDPTKKADLSKRLDDLSHTTATGEKIFKNFVKVSHDKQMAEIESNDLPALEDRLNKILIEI